MEAGRIYVKVLKLDKAIASVPKALLDNFLPFFSSGGERVKKEEKSKNKKRPFLVTRKKIGERVGKELSLGNTQLLLFFNKAANDSAEILC